MKALGLFLSCVFLFLSSASGNVCISLADKKPVEVVHTVLSKVSFSVKVSVKAAFVSSNKTNEFLVQQFRMTIKQEKTGKVVLESTLNATQLVKGTNTTELVPKHELSAIVSSGFHDLILEIELPKQCNAIPKKTLQHKFLVHAIPPYLTVFPPLLTLIIALITRQVLFALYSGIYLGCFFLYDFNPITAFIRSFDALLVEAVADKSHAVVILFSWMLTGMIAVISKAGGTVGLANEILKRGRSSTAIQLATFFMGLFIFFDDYANALIVGHTVRPITDRFHISREKLAFIVDCTSAPIASIAPISTWIGFELSLIKDEFKKLNIDNNAYFAFLRTIPYRFYPIFVLVFVFFIIVLKRDLGPMEKAELIAREKGVNDYDNMTEYTIDMNPLFQPKEGIPFRWYNAVIPVSFVIIFTLFGLILDGIYVIKELDDGTNYSLKNIFINADSFRVLMWTGALAFFVPMFLFWFQKILSPQETVYIWVEGMKELMEPVLILFLAWTLGTVVGKLQLSKWLVETLKDNMSPALLPTVIFLLSAFISFCTGSSWSTMSIMFPIFVPLAYGINNGNYEGLIDNMSSILAGSIFGDHCSPISDTTILSSLSTKCDVTEHTRTQVPYALFVAIFSVIFGTVPTALISFYTPAVGLFVGSCAIVATIYFFGSHVKQYTIFADRFTDSLNLESPSKERPSDFENGEFETLSTPDDSVPIMLYE